MISARSGGFVWFFLPKHACFALSRLRLLGEQLVATFERGVFGFRHMCASNDEIFVTLCGVSLNVFMISPTSEASLYGVFVLSNFFTARLRFNV